MEKNELLDLISRNQNAYVFIPEDYKYERMEYLYNIKHALKIYKYFDGITTNNSNQVLKMIKEKLDYDYVNYARGILDEEVKGMER